MKHANDSPLVSMLIPAYNHEAYLDKCISALIDQDYPCIELIIIDDGSTDDSVQCIEKMLVACEARFVRFEFRCRANKGLTETINEALEWAQGEYFATIASDDVLHTNKTSFLVRQIHGEAAVAGVFSGCELIDETGAITATIQPSAGCYDFADVMYRRPTIIAPSQLLRLDLLRTVGGYPKGLYFEDWYMWLALTKHGFKLKVVADVLVQYRQHDRSMSKAASKMYDGRKAMLEYFKAERGYQNAMSWVCVTAAVDYSRKSRVTSLRYLAEAAAHYPRTIISLKFYGALARVLTPHFVLDLARRYRDKRLALSSRSGW